MLSDKDLNRIWAALVSQAQRHFGITAAAQLFNEAGLLVSSGGYWAPLITAVKDAFADLDQDEKVRTVGILAGSLTTRSAEVATAVTNLLRRHGFEYMNNTFVPIGFLDEREALFLPEESSLDLSKALSRLLDDDLDGALTAACGAVDTVAGALYHAGELGDPGHDSFQQRVGKALGCKRRIEEIEEGLVGLGWSESDARIVCKNLRGALNQMAYVMQSLRSRMSDAHGSKPALRAVVYDSLKIASVLLSLMK